MQKEKKVTEKKYIYFLELHCVKCDTKTEIPEPCPECGGLRFKRVYMVREVKK